MSAQPPRSYYGTKDEYNRVHAQHRRALVLTNIQNIVVDVQEREGIKRALSRDLNGLGINI